ncbi:MAG: phage/plasmid primase, P4 family [Chloroflexota bacterium]|nr:phage/plasmid primase, P4 family [Chloroflexota bacterium]
MSTPYLRSIINLPSKADGAPPLKGKVLDEDAETTLPPPSAPMAVARQMVAERYTSAGDLLLRHWRGGWWEWRRTHWEEREERSVRRDAYAFTEHAIYPAGKSLLPWDPNRNKIQNLLEALAAITHLSEGVDQPSWLDSDGPAVVAVANGLLDLSERVLLPHTPRYFNQTAVPFGYDPAASMDRWLGFLEELWPDDRSSIEALAEFFGYVISGRLDLHKIMLVVGPTRGGKGTIARLLGKMIGPRSVAGPTLSSLSYDFGMAPLIGKPLAVISDARLDAKANTSVVVERLLSISGEDTLTVNRKYRDQWTGKLPTRFLVISNELPRLGDASGTIANRFVVLLLTRSWLGQEDTGLEDRLTADLAGILNWSLAGLDRLTEQGRFTRPVTTDEAIIALQDLASPVSAFVRDLCTIGPTEEVAITTLYEAWKHWTEDNGHRGGSKQVFGRNLRSVIPGLRVTQSRDGDERERVYRGVRLGTQRHARPANHDAGETGGPRTDLGLRSPSPAHNEETRVPSRATPPSARDAVKQRQADLSTKSPSGTQWHAIQPNVVPAQNDNDDEDVATTPWCRNYSAHQSFHKQIATGIWWCEECRIDVEVPV